MTNNANQNQASEKKVGLIRVDRLYESLRYNEYSPENGMGEIVDNSVEAGATRIDVKITRMKQQGKGKPKTKIQEVAVIDNGCGMDEEILSKCLALGESVRPMNRGKMGIGRFGVGMTLGSISLARRIEVYSRAKASDAFLNTFIDLEMIGTGNQLYIPYPVAKEPKADYAELLNNSSGTIVILSDCDRISGDMEGLANYLGRTYRKFIERGLKIYMGTKTAGDTDYKTEQVFLHDPLYLAGPTKFDNENREAGKPFDPKASDWGTARIPVEVTGQPGKTADVLIRMSLLPEEWRMVKGDGGSPEARKRRIHENEGFSILRADREVLYGHVPYMTGTKGTAKAEDIDRFWGCEISFPPELDDYFQVRYIKRGAEPVEGLKEKIRTEVMKYIPSARKMIKEHFAKNEAAKGQEQDKFEAAEAAMAAVTYNLPMGLSTKNMTAEEAERKLDLAAQESLETKRTDKQEQKAAEEKKKEELKVKPFSVEPVSYPKSFLFDTVHIPNSVIIKLNVNHPFYEKVMKPLCGIDGADGSWEASAANKKVWDAMLMLLFAYAKAETMFDQSNNALFDNLKSQWGAFLGTAIEDSYKDGDGA